MLVIKLGGSCLKNADSFNKAVDLIKQYYDDVLIVVVSALGKSTSLLDHITHFALKNKKTFVSLQNIINIHLAALSHLSTDRRIEGERFIVSQIYEIESRLRQLRISEFLRHRDTILSLGEVLSSKILSLYIEDYGIDHRLLDSREIIKTDDYWGHAEVDIAKTTHIMNQRYYNIDSKLFILQGFIGSNNMNQTTTLGFEGSDYTASLVANILDADKLILWKDVKGIYRNDPDLGDSELYDTLSYEDLYNILKKGAKVVHQKSIEILKQKNIPLQVRSFYDIGHEGTFIR